MNATTTTTAAIDDVAAFAARVRAHLDDLPADEVDDLLDGLEADLAEQAADSGEGYALPDAAAYADELRVAAGLPERQPTAPRAPLGRRIAARTADRWEGALRDMRASRGGAWLLDLLASLRPVWWVLRGWALYAALSFMVGSPPLPTDGLVGLIVLIALVLVSVQWGRGQWMPRRWIGVLRTVVSVVAITVLPFAVAAVSAWSSGAYGYGYGAQSVEYIDSSQPGLAVDGERVRNIFAYDADGNPIEAVQLYDQDGRALTTTGDVARAEDWDHDAYFYGGGGPVPVPFTGTGRQAVWNVFPLRELPTTSWEDASIDVDEAETPVFPFPQAPSFREPSAQATPTPTPTTPTPAETPSQDAPVTP